MVIQSGNRGQRLPEAQDPGATGAVADEARGVERVVACGVAAADGAALAAGEGLDDLRPGAVVVRIAASSSSRRLLSASTVPSRAMIVMRKSVPATSCRNRPSRVRSGPEKTVGAGTAAMSRRVSWPSSAVVASASVRGRRIDARTAARAEGGQRRPERR